MESLGGDELWVDRFIAQHAAVVYYWILLGLYWFNPDLVSLSTCAAGICVQQHLKWPLPTRDLTC